MGGGGLVGLTARVQLVHVALQALRLPPEAQPQLPARDHRRRSVSLLRLERRRALRLGRERSRCGLGLRGDDATLGHRALSQTDGARHRLQATRRHRGVKSWCALAALA